MQRFDLLGRSDNLRDGRRFAQSADHFVVIAMADQDQRIAFLGELDGLDVDLGDQRTGGVNDAQACAVLLACADFGRNAVGAVDDALAVRELRPRCRRKSRPLRWSSSTTKRLWTISLRT